MTNTRYTRFGYAAIHNVALRGVLASDAWQEGAARATQVEERWMAARALRTFLLLGMQVLLKVLLPVSGPLVQPLDAAGTAAAAAGVGMSAVPVSGLD